MIIQNKKTGQRQAITAEQWETLKNVGFQSKWNVISKDDPIPVAKTIPLEIKEFSKIKHHGKRKNS